ncbi:MAG TPA: hypothetical protein VGR70_08030 [Stellaceae bacterium]|nr:hypothetical protein [Stellaceae bacterium]
MKEPIKAIVQHSLSKDQAASANEHSRSCYPGFKSAFSFALAHFTAKRALDNAGTAFNPCGWDGGFAPAWFIRTLSRDQPHPKLIADLQFGVLDPLYIFVSSRIG